MKIKAIGIQLLSAFVDLPLRIKRIVFHFLWFIPRVRYRYPQLEIVNGLFEWVLFIPFYLIDLLAIPNLYQIILEFIFWHSRSLGQNEESLATALYGNALKYDRIRINEREKFVARRLRIAYVSFDSIHSAIPLNHGLFLHELSHVWQYQQFGSVYILKTLKAQKSKEGYNYGGKAALLSFLKRGRSIYHFNFEQQGDIIQDYYLLVNNKAPRWIDADRTNISYLYPFIADLNRMGRGFKSPGKRMSDNSHIHVA